MLISSKEAEQAAVLSTAEAMCAAARTAPKAKGVDLVETAILTGEDKERLADEMERLGAELSYGFFLRDAQNVRDSAAVVLVGVRYSQRGLGAGCSRCGFDGCAACASAGGVCVYDPLDLGIALGGCCGSGGRSPCGQPHHVFLWTGRQHTVPAGGGYSSGDGDPPERFGQVAVF